MSHPCSCYHFFHLLLPTRGCPPRGFAATTTTFRVLQYTCPPLAPRPKSSNMSCDLSANKKFACLSFPCSPAYFFVNTKRQQTTTMSSDPHPPTPIPAHRITPGSHRGAGAVHPTPTPIVPLPPHHTTHCPARLRCQLSRPLSLAPTCYLGAGRL